ncbi:MULTISPECIES: beta-phosphoglucomutase [Sphingobacterium]|jgi:beta-phosphoglucomutase|uniref:Beta-phosphoglucomutase n=1 Tax=Sphingobacterium kitahiroshimense TaxID=470446 RepID=A0ABV0C2K4_9SPHI|nr:MULTISPECIES: beta-phosphoglucomutase [Sphingobacterium]KKX48965.1 beta-phosphoglucomutase [Sphingobacterium sp. IITKGP-BTPF85]MBB2952683.1 beta-phosphoglucomutase [Sphingobacterium sp. JUb56]MCS3556070.1 beta-phosphoglucomutase [Sphingobacterium sp. JUb21]MCW2261144.1 beta-phosphoglucomutase [Sphingobacterium kitahiroshimense]NJI76215.1 beta-phosphoglucomutase [Sphingobacterium sp. B16(2022)]
MKSALDLLKEIKGVIFDLDGVLVDTAVFHFQAWKRLAQELGFDFTEIENEQLKGVSRIASLEKILNWAGVDASESEKIEMAERKNRWYLDLVEQMKADEILPGSLELLHWLKKNGYQVALGSASKNAPLILEKTGMISFFDVLVDGNSVSLSKPNPEVFLKAARDLKLLPEVCLVFEDAQAGVDAARAAGMSVIGIGSNLNGTDLSISSLEEVLN